MEKWKEYNKEYYIKHREHLIEKAKVRNNIRDAKARKMKEDMKNDIGKTNLKQAYFIQTLTINFND